MQYYSVLQTIHSLLKPHTYLETGVRNGDSIALASRDTYAYGIDPNPDIKKILGERTKVFACTSDEFFERFDMQEELKAPLDMCFLDGMHLFEFALRDFINMEALCNKRALIAVHDCLPADAAMASRERITQKWCGDVFKLLLALKKYRPELEFLHLASDPSGLLLVKNVNPSSTVLRDNYKKILHEFLPFQFKRIENKIREALFVTEYNDNVLNDFIKPCPAIPYNQPSEDKASVTAANYLFSKQIDKKKVNMLGVLLCYNDGDFLAENIEYLLSQNHHIIAWDHGSTDDTPLVLEKYKEHLLETRYIPRQVDFYDLYQLMSARIIKQYKNKYDIISWPDQDEILEGPFRDKSYYEYLIEFYDSPFSWIRFNNMNFWYSPKDNCEEKTIDRVKYYSFFPNCSPRIRAWKSQVTNIRIFNHNPLASGVELPIAFNLRHYPFRTKEQMERRINVDRANLMRGTSNYHYEQMKSRLEALETFDASKELHFDDGKELNRNPDFDWMKFYGHEQKQ